MEAGWKHICNFEERLAPFDAWQKLALSEQKRRKHLDYLLQP
jgi:hypothetical protein